MNHVWAAKNQKLNHTPKSAAVKPSGGQLSIGGIILGGAEM